VLHAGHGEFSRAIFTPGSVEECFYLARAACFLAERSQGPVFILTDQYQADSLRAVSAFKVEQLASVDIGCEAAEAESPYERYRITENGVSPRHIPGWTKNLVVADSDEHTPDGHLTEDLVAAEQMTRKRLRKLSILKDETIPPERWGVENPDLLLVTWGSGKGPVIEAAQLLSASENRTVSALHFSQVWPMIPGHFLETLQGAKEVVSVEGNATGQLARLIRRETGFEIARRVLRFDGLPLTPEYIIENISAASGKGEE
jgi:2-oxoglutarate ferredoxin oxidoreductase subunit alpha